MFSPLAVAAVLWAFAEYVVFRLTADALGVGSALLVTVGVSALAVVVGWAKVRFFVADSVRSAVAGGVGGGDARLIAADRMVRIGAFVLCVVPGLASGALGLALLLPPLRKAAAARAAPRLTSLSTFSFDGFGGFGSSRSGDVIDTDLADAARTSDDAPHPHSPARSELG